MRQVTMKIISLWSLGFLCDASLSGGGLAGSLPLWTEYDGTTENGKL
jgi:hypothetical protein